MAQSLTRRGLLAGATRPEHHISSAVVAARPEAAPALAERLAALPDTEVHAVSAGKIVLVLEGPSTGALGARLAEIACMDDVLSANMVYEVIDDGGSEGDAP